MSQSRYWIINEVMKPSGKSICQERIVNNETSMEACAVAGTYLSACIQSERPHLPIFTVIVSIKCQLWVYRWRWWRKNWGYLIEQTCLIRRHRIMASLTVFIRGTYSSSSISTSIASLSIPFCNGYLSRHKNQHRNLLGSGLLRPQELVPWCLLQVLPSEICSFRF